MSRGKRYSHEPKLNIKKVIAVILVIVVIVMFAIAIKKLINSDEANNNIVATTYFTLYSNDKWGVIDNNAKTIIEPIYNEMIIIPDNKKDVFICTENVDYDNNTYTTKVLNSKNKEIFKQYNKIQAIENYDEYNNLWYEENVLKFEKDGKYGLIDLEGKVLLEANYNDIYSLKGVKGSIITVQDEKQGVVDTKGTQIVPNNYSEVKSLGEDTNLYIVKDDKNNYGIYNKLDVKYQEIKQLNNEDLYCVKENNKYKVINEEEKEVFDLEFDDIKQIQDNIIVYTKNNQYGAYSTTQNKGIKAEYDNIQYTCNNNFIVKKNNSYGIVDVDNNIKQKIEYSFIGYYEDAEIYELESKNSENNQNTILNNNLQEIVTGIVNEVSGEKSYIRVWNEDGYKFYNLLGEEQDSREILTQNKIFLKKENGKYGFIDKDGNVVVDYIYDDAKEQNEYGFAAVKKDGKWGAIDTQGNIVCEINYDLDENLLIDFIGKYHLGKDINLLYYTDR